MIEIDQRNDQCAYIKVGNITVYVEDSEAAPEYVHVWRNRNVELFLTSDGEVEINGGTK
jgi:hypothetical protein